MFLTMFVCSRGGGGFPACITGHMIGEGGLHLVVGWADSSPLPLPADTRDTTGYGQQVGGTHAIGMLSCLRTTTNFLFEHLQVKLLKSGSFYLIVFSSCAAVYPACWI